MNDFDAILAELESWIETHTDGPGVQPGIVPRLLAERRADKAMILSLSDKLAVCATTIARLAERCTWGEGELLGARALK